MQISLSNDTIKSRIHEMSDNIKSKVIDKTDSSPFVPLKLDESTIMSPISHTYWSIAGMLDMEQLRNSFSSANSWKQHKKQVMFFKF